MDSFLILAHRYGETGSHTYPAGVAADLGVAKIIADEVAFERSNKYQCRVLKYNTNSPKDYEVVYSNIEDLTKFK
jgi:hypothetical protein